MKVFDRLTISFDSSNPAHWLILILLLALLIMQIGLTVRNPTFSGQRKTVRLGLNLLFWLVLVGYFLQPKWWMEGQDSTVLIADNEVPTEYINQLKDSLHLERSARVSSFTTSRFRAQLADGTVDAVTLVGTGFSPDVLGQLSRQTVRWVPYEPADQVQLLRWKAVLRKEELQTVTGTIQSSRKQVLAVRFGRQTLDSLELKPGFQSFQLQFPAFAQGRTAVELVLDGRLDDTLRFFTQKPQPVAYQFILDSPDFESKTLADWLGKKGYSVQLNSVVSKDISNSVRINRAAAPDVIITNPGNATNPVVRKAILQGKTVLFMNTTDPEADSRTINQALGTSWQVRKISNETTVSIGGNLQALPYQFREKMNQFPVDGYPVAIQKTGATIGFSLLSETYPLKLSGDSVAYDRVWTAILTPLQPVATNTVRIDAPVFTGLPTDIQVNHMPTKPAVLRINDEVIPLQYSPLNPLSAEAQYRFGRSGWQALGDSLAVYVDPPDVKTGFGHRLVSAYLRARSAEATLAKTARQRAYSVQPPDWTWLLLLIGCWAALWLEPKFSV